jgi:uncharacterized protein YcbK (DUF882 family)
MSFSTTPRGAIVGHIRDLPEFEHRAAPPFRDPLEAVGAALDDALALSRPAHDEGEPDPASAEAWANASATPAFAAWLRVDEAANLSRIQAAPSPAPRPVSIERQRAAREQRTVPPGELHLYVSNTRESYRIRLYDADGRMRTDAVREAARALRDQRSGLARSPHPRLLAMLYIVGQHFDAQLEVVSGYRVRGVNASEGSRHGSGEACDIRIRDVGYRTLSSFAERTFARVGIGFYPTSRFVHLDHRRTTYYWVDYSGPGQRSRTRSRPISTRANPADDPTLRSVHVTEEELYVLPPSLQGFGYN